MFARGRALLRQLLVLGFLPAQWRIPCMVAAGVALGLGVAVAHVSRAASYMTDEPETCVNCHVMMPQYATWQHSSHARVATCNDCHVPHDTVFNQYSFKARDGMYHSYVFTLRKEPQVIQLSAGAVPVVEANCRRCHAQLVDDLHLLAHQDGDHRCWDCHREVPHGSVRSLSATPRVMNPQLPSVTDLKQRPTIGGREARPDSQEKPR